MTSAYQEIQSIAPDVKIVGVTKNHLWPEIAPLYEAGLRDFGENRVQEALPKMEASPKDCRWHFIGTLQKNKVNKVVGRFDLIHSVDSLELARKISDASMMQSIRTPILLQVNIDHEHGFTEEEIIPSFEIIKNLPGISVEGLMTMAPLTDDDARIRRCFRKAGDLKTKLGLKELSMGMSHDWKIALEEGSTMLRIGSLFF